jgi:hypothetical protein
MYVKQFPPGRNLHDPDELLDAEERHEAGEHPEPDGHVVRVVAALPAVAVAVAVVAVPTRLGTSLKSNHKQD